MHFFKLSFIRELNLLVSFLWHGFESSVLFWLSHLESEHLIFSFLDWVLVNKVVEYWLRSFRLEHVCLRVNYCVLRLHFLLVELA